MSCDKLAVRLALASKPQVKKLMDENEVVIVDDDKHNTDEAERQRLTRLAEVIRRRHAQQQAEIDAIKRKEAALEQRAQAENNKRRNEKSRRDRRNRQARASRKRNRR